MEVKATNKFGDAALRSCGNVTRERRGRRLGTGVGTKKGAQLDRHWAWRRTHHLDKQCAACPG